MTKRVLHLLTVYSTSCTKFKAKCSAVGIKISFLLYVIKHIARCSKKVNINCGIAVIIYEKESMSFTNI